MAGDHQNRLTPVVAQIPQHRGIAHRTFAKRPPLKFSPDPVKDVNVLQMQPVQIGPQIGKTGRGGIPLTDQYIVRRRPLDLQPVRIEASARRRKLPVELM